MSDTESFYKEMAARGETSQGYQDFGKWLSEVIPAKAEWLGVNLNAPGGLKVLDYAAGPGVVSKAIGPYARNVVAVDSSKAMMETYGNKFKGQEDKFKGYLGDLVGPEDDPKFDGDEFRGFDLIIVSMAFHHFEDPARAAKKLAARLKEGGVLLIFEFKPGGGRRAHARAHGHDHGHSHHHDHEHHHGHSHFANPHPDFDEHAPMGFEHDAIANLLRGPCLKDVDTFDAEVSFVWKIDEEMKVADVMAFDFVYQKDFPEGDPPVKKDIIVARATKA